MLHLLVPENKARLELYENGFYSIDDGELTEAEKSLGTQFPEQLRAFYVEVGWGRLQTGANSRYTMSKNWIFPCEDVPQLLNGTCEWMMPYTQIQPDTLPFFERDVDLFLCLHPKSENPNAVHWMWGDKICDSLVEFFQRLVEDPDWFNPPKP